MGNAEVPERSVIELRLPPLLRFASVVRVIAASLAADENFSIAALAELGTAVHDAFSLVLEETVPYDRSDADAILNVRFSVSPGRVQVEFSVASDGRSRAVASPRSQIVQESEATLVIENGRVTLCKPDPPVAVSAER